MTFPLLLTADGKKFGKSEGGAVWLGADKLSPYRFYQYLFRTPDADVIKFLRMLTFLDLCEIEALEQAMERGEGYRPNTAQRLLAEEVTRFVHGEAGVELAQKATAALAPGSKADLEAETLAALAEELPTSALGAACVGGHKEAISMLMANGASAERLDTAAGGSSMLVKCAQTGSAETMKALTPHPCPNPNP